MLQRKYFEVNRAIKLQKFKCIVRHSRTVDFTEFGTVVF